MNDMHLHGSVVYFGGLPTVRDRSVVSKMISSKIFHYNNVTIIDGKVFVTPIH